MGFFDDGSAEAEVAPEEVSAESMVDMGTGDVEATSAEDPGHSPQQLDGEEPSPTNVPLQELINERRKRQDVEADMQEQRQSNAVLNERIRNMWETQQAQQQQQTQQQQAQQQAQQDPPPDPEEDPLGHATWRIKNLESQIRGMATVSQRQAQAQQQAQQQQAQSTEMQSIVSQSQTLQTQFAAQNPEYWEAYEFLETSRAAELASMGYDESAVQEVIANERGMIVTQSLTRDAEGRVTGWKQNPAEVAYKLAKGRGFMSKAAAAAASQPNSTAVDVPVQDRMAMVASGQAAASSVGTSGRTGRPSGAPTLESIAAMSDVEFERFSRTNPGIVEALLSST